MKLGEHHDQQRLKLVPFAVKKFSNNISYKSSSVKSLSRKYWERERHWNASITSYLNAAALCERAAFTITPWYALRIYALQMRISDICRHVLLDKIFRFDLLFVSHNTVSQALCCVRTYSYIQCEVTWYISFWYLHFLYHYISQNAF